MDPKVYLLITGQELDELKRHTWLMAEAYGFDKRMERYQGKRPMGFQRWDLDCLIASIDVALMIKNIHQKTVRNIRRSVDCISGSKMNM